MDFRSEEFIKWRSLQDNSEMREKIQITIISSVMGCHLPEALNLYPHAVQTDDDVLLVAVVGQGRLFPDVGAGVHPAPGQFVQEVVSTDHLQVPLVRDVHLAGVLSTLGEVHLCPVKQCLLYPSLRENEQLN